MVLLNYGRMQSVESLVLAMLCQNSYKMTDCMPWA